MDPHVPGKPQAEEQIHHDAHVQPGTAHRNKEGTGQQGSRKQARVARQRVLGLMLMRADSVGPCQQTTDCPLIRSTVLSAA